MSLQRGTINTWFDLKVAKCDYCGLLLFYTYEIVSGWVGDSRTGKNIYLNIWGKYSPFYRRICSFAGYSSHPIQKSIWKPWLVYIKVGYGLTVDIRLGVQTWDFPPLSVATPPPPPVLLILVVHLDLRIYPRIFEKIWNGLNEILWGWGETDSWKKPEAKKSRYTVPLMFEAIIASNPNKNLVTLSFIERLVYGLTISIRLGVQTWELPLSFFGNPPSPPQGTLSVKWASYYVLKSG